MMLEVAEKYQRAFELMIDEDGHFLNYLYEDGGGKRGLGSPTNDDWHNIRHFIKFLQVFYDVTMQISEYSESSDPLLNTMANRMKVKYDKYWGDVEKINPLLFVASLLDLRYKMVNSTKFPILAEIARDVLAIPITTVASDSAFSTGGRVIDPYRSSLAPKTVEALFPILAEIARDLLAIPITTIASESTFSTGGRVIDPYRGSLAPKTVEALVCTQNWLRFSPNSAHESYLFNVEDEESYKLDSGITWKE
ncbi:uncharacterized protein LOC133862044 [Alnus glutinosa]|uniref:uncharacterized protein LOC133862044 n=1 Tax=Alnus glutinosa TaxID=3517 RepID=UPI002D7894BE|nr:uncharacterized protein LOC133862044 [Alnus glutinosa]